MSEPSRAPRPEKRPDQAAKQLSSLGASKGGRARAEKLTPERRAEIARRASAARWPQKQKDDDVQDRLPRAPSRSPLSITATEISGWARQRTAQQVLPALVRRLVRASPCKLAIPLSMPSGEGVQGGGWDGRLIAEVKSEYVPLGPSVWEMSTNLKPAAKATSDYRKRTDEPGDVDPSQTTYIAVTARAWSAKEKWAADRRAEGRWKDVRAYDAHDLEAWLEQHVAVEAWFANVTGLLVDGVETIESAWEAWAGFTDPPMTRELMVAGRDKTVASIADLLERGAQTFAVQAGSQNEALAVLLATLQSLPSDRRDAIASQTVVVRSPDALRAIAIGSRPLVLVSTVLEEDAVTIALRRGHRVLLALGPADMAREDRVVVEKLDLDAASRALEQMDLAATEVEDLARTARRSIDAFRREKAASSAGRRPPWSKGDDARRLAPLFLLSMWNGAVAGDKAIVAELAGRPYEDVETDARRWTKDGDPPISPVGSVWRIVSRTDAWDLIGDQISESDLARFRDAALRVFSTTNPALELDQEKRWMAGALGKTPTHSGVLRDAIADTLAFMASRTPNESHGVAIDVSAFARRLVAEILDAAIDEPRVWLSITHAFRLFAEAAPEQFCDFVERTIASGCPTPREIFGDSGNPMFSSSPHTNLLWALETVAWSREHLGRVAVLLAKLHEIDPGGNLANRPLETLRQILCSWLPQTDAPVQVRIEVVDNLRRWHGATAWKLLQKLAPTAHQVGHYTCTPRWREWGQNQRRRATTRREHYEMVKHVLDASIEDVGVDAGRWCDLLEHLTSLPDTERRTIAAKLDGVDPSRFDDDGRAAILAKIRGFVAQHRTSPDANWAAAEADLAAFENVGRKFEPTSAARRFGWLFSFMPAIPEGREGGWKEHEAKVQTHRLAAIKETFEKEGVEGVVALAAASEVPAAVGATFGLSEFLGRDEELALLAGQLGSTNGLTRNFIAGFVQGRTQLRGLEWAEESATAQSFTPEQRAEILCTMGACPRTWDLADRLGTDVADEYWRSVMLFHVEVSDVDRAVTMLLAHRRPFSAVDILGMHHKEDLDLKLMLAALEAVPTGDPTIDRSRSSVGYWIGELLAKLAAAPGVDETRVARIEWALLPVIDKHDYAPVMLHRHLDRDPVFFADALCRVFKGRSEPSRDLSEADQAMGRRAYDLLQEWRTIPGVRDDGTVNGDHLRWWVREARQLVRDRDREEVGDEMIGQLLSGSPAGSDGAWPHEAVRDVIEDAASRHLDIGIYIGRRNSRGVISRALAEGGVKERKLAAEYAAHAEAVQAKWPRTASVLRQIVAAYEGEAKQEDLEAEQWRDLGR